MKISKLLKISTSIILVLLILVVSSVYYLNINFKQERKAVSKREDLKNLGREMLMTVNELSSLAYKYVQTSDRKYAVEYLKKADEIKKREEIVTKFKEMEIPEGELNLIEEAVNKSNIIIRYEKVAIEAVKSGNISAAKRKLFNSYYTRRKKAFQDTLSSFQSKLDKRTQKIKDSAQNKATFTLLLTVVIIIIIAIVIVITFILLYNKITTPIDKAVKFADKIANGNLTASHLEVQGIGEIAELSMSLNKMQDNLKESIKSILELEEETFKLVKETDDKINSGTELVNSAVEIMKELEGSVSKVDGISEKIMKIADETNLLSLDGAIEAAGEESGHGFAAIADDIKDLANESMRSAQEVKEIVEEVQDVTNRAINIMISANDSERNIADVFREIEDLSNNLIVKVEEVTAATEEQIVSTQPRDPS
ncbi:MAG: HAMP domain-containing methyl-accepting chemotaxis protein [Halanaerobacter sp.]